MAGFSSLLIKELSTLSKYFKHNLDTQVLKHRVLSNDLVSLLPQNWRSSLGTLRRSREARPTIQPFRVIFFLHNILNFGLAEAPEDMRYYCSVSGCFPFTSFTPNRGGQWWARKQILFTCESSSFVSNLPLFSSPEFEAELFPFLFFIL